MEHPEAKQKNLPVKPLLAAVCVVIVLVLGIFAFQYRQSHTVQSILTVDVNPSVELRLNQKARVVEAVAVNEDGAELLKDMDLRGTELNVAVNALMGAMLRYGYVDETTGAILISVADKDGVRGAALRLAAEEEASAILDAASVPVEVLAQSVPRDAALEEKAAQYGISIGKARMIETMAAGSDHWTFETLAGLTVNELYLLSSDPAGLAEQPQSSYIAADDAKAAAFAYAGVTAAQAFVEKVEFDYENGAMVYEVEFIAGDMEYDCNVDAVTGAVIGCKTEPVQSGVSQNGTAPDGTAPVQGQDTQTPAAPSSGTQQKIGAAQAGAIALEHAGLTESQVTGLRTESEWDDGLLEYHVEFYTGEIEYEYEINAYTGEILKAEQEYWNRTSHRENHHEDQHHSAVPGVPSAAYIGIDAAQAAAYRHAGVDATSVYDLSLEEKLDERTPHYEVEFKAGGMEYEYDIDAQTGAVLNYESEWDD